MKERFFIGPYKSGEIQDKKPFLIPDEAFERMRNVYVFRDRVVKRFGSQVMNPGTTEGTQQFFTRFRIKLAGTTDNTGAYIGTIPGGATPIATFAAGQLFSADDGTDFDVFTVIESTVTIPPHTLKHTMVGSSATFDPATGNITLANTVPNADVYYYPALPVMSLITDETAATNEEQLIGFDTRFAYTFNGASWSRLDTAYNWTGNDFNFFWGANYRGALPNEKFLFVTNNFFNNIGNYDPMAYYDDNTTSFTAFQPYYRNDGTNLYRVLTAKIIIPFYNRLILLNTTEEIQGGVGVFQNRARWCQNGNPVDQGSGTGDKTGAWLEPPAVYGRGDHLDAPTNEAIQTALILKDRLIVYFERSTWELVYTGNQVLPFIWQTINIELGAESTFSVVPFDAALLGVGDVGIHACNGANVTRIDESIPDQVFEIQNINNGVDRVYGIRDYATEMVYWAYPYESRTDIKFPNKVLVYNYRNDAWAYNDDSITAFGQIQIDTSLTWASADFTWAEGDMSWDAGTEQTFSRNVIAGNQQGFCFLLSPPMRQLPKNAYAYSVTDITSVDGAIATITVIDHNLTNGDYIGLANIVALDDPDGTYDNLNDKIYQITYVDPNTFTIAVPNYPNGFIPLDANATYAGNGTMKLVSVIDMWTKQFNFYMNQAYSLTINKIDFLVDRNDLVNEENPIGEVTVRTYVNTSRYSTNESILSMVPYDPIYAPMEQVQSSLWHTIYPDSFGTFFQFQITQTDNLDYNLSQLRNPDIVERNFVLNAMVINAGRTSSRLQ